jgi:peptide/nickel transport system permease protein
MSEATTAGRRETPPPTPSPARRGERPPRRVGDSQGPGEGLAVAPGRSLRRPSTPRRLFRNRQAAIGGLLIVGMILAAIFAPQLAPWDPLGQQLTRRLEPPIFAGGSGVYPLGSDPNGRDILSRLLYGARVSLSVGVLSMLLAGSVGVLLGLLSGYFGGGLDDLIMRLADVQLAFPVILLAITIVSVVGRNVATIVAVLGLTGWVVYARTVRSSVLSLRERDFVQAARCLGAGHRRILLRHILPNTVAPILVVATVQVATMIVLESGLSFFGLGIQPPTPTWGGMLAEGRDYLSNAWWVSTIPGLAIMLTVLGINLLGDGLRDVFDPQLKDY